MIIISTFMGILRWGLNPSFILGMTVDHFIIVSVISFILIPAVKKGSQETSSLPFFRQKLYIANKRLSKSGTYAFWLMIFAVGLIRFILGKAFGSKVFNYIIALHSIIPYVLVMLAIIGSIEVYKKIYNRN
jgi:hypothetical protein